MRSRSRFRPFAQRGRRTVVAILVLFALLSVTGILLTARATARSRNRATVVELASRQRILTERYVNAVLLQRNGAESDPGSIASLLRHSSRVLLDGGTAPSVAGDDDATSLPAAIGKVARAQLHQERRLIDDLTRTGAAMLAGTPLEEVPLTAGERIELTDPVARLRVLAALTENVSLNAARTMAKTADRNVSELMAFQLTLGSLGLAGALLLGWALVTATRRQTAHFRSLVSASTDLVFVFVGDDCAYVSQSVTRLVGCDESALLGKGYTELLHPDDRPLLASLLATGEPQELVFRVTNQLGEWRHLEANVTDLRADRRVRGLVLNARDITERLRLERELTHRAFHDELTGLANRALFRDRLDHALARSERSHEPVVVLLIDLDWFKQVNDSLGHDAGDRLLQELARRFARALRPSDTIARLGGDEFAILLEGSSEQDAITLAARLLDEMRRDPVVVDGRDLVLDASIGIASHEAGDTSPGRSEELVRRADVAMYAAKDAGRGRCEVFRPEMLRDSGELLGMERDLRRGLRVGEVSVHYQPSVDLRTHAIVGVEALVRWSSPTRGQVSPDRFVPVAESAGLIHELGAFVLREAARQTARWERQGLLDDDFVTWVNVSAVQLSDRRITDTVRATLRRAGLAPGRLGIEVTETAIVVDGAPAEQVRTALQELHDLGIGIALDDFGTGFSSLGHLRRFPIDIIKVDRSFIQGIEHDPKDAAITANLASLAHALHLLAVAEGIETPGQLEILRDLGCDLGQGYLLGRPMSADALAQLLVHRRAPAPVQVG